MNVYPSKNSNRVTNPNISLAHPRPPTFEMLEPALVCVSVCVCVIGAIPSHDELICVDHLKTLSQDMLLQTDCYRDMSLSAVNSVETF